MVQPRSAGENCQGFSRFELKQNADLACSGAGPDDSAHKEVPSGFKDFLGEQVVSLLKDVPVDALEIHTTGRTPGSVLDDPPNKMILGFVFFF